MVTMNRLHFVRPWRLLRDVVDLCYPPTCAACQAFCGEAGELCGGCSAQLQTLESTPACDLCGRSLAYPDAPCPHCLGLGISHYDRVVRLASFDPPLRLLVHRFKYHGHWPVGEMLADRLLGSERAKGLLSEADCLLPVPLHRLRQFVRGYNQAHVVAQRLGRRCNLPLADAVARHRYTQTQTHLHSRRQRMRNLKDAFVLKDPDQIRRRHIVVIDDVMTTGATLQILARALRPARPASLSAIVVAVADPKKMGT